MKFSDFLIKNNLSEDNINFSQFGELNVNINDIDKNIHKIIDFIKSKGDNYRYISLIYYIEYLLFIDDEIKLNLFLHDLSKTDIVFFSSLNYLCLSHYITGHVNFFEFLLTNKKVSLFFRALNANYDKNNLNVNFINNRSLDILDGLSDLFLEKTNDYYEEIKLLTENILNIEPSFNVMKNSFVYELNEFNFYNFFIKLRDCNMISFYSNIINCDILTYFFNQGKTQYIVNILKIVNNDLFLEKNILKIYNETFMKNYLFNDKKNTKKGFVGNLLISLFSKLFTFDKSDKLIYLNQKKFFEENIYDLSNNISCKNSFLNKLLIHMLFYEQNQFIIDQFKGGVFFVFINKYKLKKIKSFKKVPKNILLFSDDGLIDPDLNIGDLINKINFLILNKNSFELNFKIKINFRKLYSYLNINDTLKIFDFLNNIIANNFNSFDVFDLEIDRNYYFRKIIDEQNNLIVRKNGNTKIQRKRV